MQLREYLEREGMSDLAFARQIGVTRQSVYGWINKGRMPELRQLIKISRATGGEVTANDFIIDRIVWQSVGGE